MAKNLDFCFIIKHVRGKNFILNTILIYIYIYTIPSQNIVELSFPTLDFWFDYLSKSTMFQGRLPLKKLNLFVISRMKQSFKVKGKSMPSTRNVLSFQRRVDFPL